MSVIVACPECGRSVGVQDDSHGKRFRCPTCGNVVIVAINPRPPPAPLTPEVAPPVPIRTVEVFEGPLVGPTEAYRRLFPDVGEFGFRCRHCQSTRPPLTRTKVSGAGWFLFFILAVFLCLPLCWIGLLMKEEYRVCGDCGRRLV